MPLPPTIIASLRFNRFAAGRLVEDVPEEKMTTQAAGVRNHAAWQLGHLVVTLAAAGKMIGAGYAHPAGWDNLFGMGSQPTADRAAYPTKAALLAELDKAVDAIIDRLSVLNDDALAAPSPSERMRPMLPTLGDMVMGLCGSHFGFHSGQLSAWRRVVGLPQAFPGAPA